MQKRIPPPPRKNKTKTKPTKGHYQCTALRGGPPGALRCAVPWAGETNHVGELLDGLGHERQCACGALRRVVGAQAKQLGSLQVARVIRVIAALPSPPTCARACAPDQDGRIEEAQKDKARHAQVLKLGLVGELGPHLLPQVGENALQRHRTLVGRLCAGAA
jgi:hypothetical protein